MYRDERIKMITEILKQNGYVTVKFLMNELHYSVATINRDLNYMQNQKLIKRSYGGVELTESKSVPLVFRYNKMRPSKNKIGQAAAELVQDGDVIFIDGSTTAQYMGKYITGKKELMVITNNITLASYLSENNISVVCLGGRIVEPPSMICSNETVDHAMEYTADKMFFSTGGFTPEGKIVNGDMYYMMHKAMRRNSDKAYFLVDGEKITESAVHYWGDLSDVDGIITDYVFEDWVKEVYSKTKFIEIK